MIRFSFALLFTPMLIAAELPKPEKGTVEIQADDEKSGVPERYRMKAAKFDFEMVLKYRLSASEIDVFTLTFPSPVKSKEASNDTVFAEYFRPKNATKRPGVLILDILDGALVVARGEALWLAQHDIPSLIVQMPYYGPRRPPGSKERMLTADVPKSIANIEQAVLDGRRALAWLETRPEVDPQKLAVLGTSLGSFVGGVIAGVEPKVKSACLLLGGGGLIDSFSEHPKAGPVLGMMALVGITPDKLKAMIAGVDPITYARGLKGKRLLLIGASRDDIVPPSAMKRLWEATGKPKIIWVDETHVGAALHLIQMLRSVTGHLNEK